MLPLQIAVRFLKSSLGQTFLIILGISVGVSVQVFIGSLIGGLQQDLVNTTIGNSSQVTITKEDDTDFISNYDTLRNDLIEIEGIESVSYTLDQAATMINGDDSEPVLLRGFNIDYADDIYGVKEKMVEGSLPTSINQIVIGTSLQEELNLSLNDQVDIQVPLVGSTTMTVVGFYDFKVSSVNNLWIVSTVETVQGATNNPNVVSSIEMQVEDVFEAETISTVVATELNDSTLDVSNWIEQNADLLSGLQAQSSSSLMIQVFVTISVVLGITSVLAITVIQKSKQIGILKAMGIKDKQASLIFLSEGFILGVFGAIGGIFLGLLLSWSFSTFAVDESGNPVVTLLINPQFMAISGMVAIVSASLASVIPARRSSRLSVIEVIRNG
jgi:lipoprotein-releasing system permease protein